MTYPQQSSYQALDFANQPPLSAGVDCAGIMRLATLGAVIGGSVAAARQFRLVQQGQQLPNTALLETGRTAVAAGIATAAGSALASSVSEHGPLRLGILLLVGAAVVYGAESWGEREALDDE
jgi:hypothetical protein